MPKSSTNQGLKVTALLTLEETALLHEAKAILQKNSVATVSNTEVLRFALKEFHGRITQCTKTSHKS